MGSRPQTPWNEKYTDDLSTFVHIISTKDRHAEQQESCSGYVGWSLLATGPHKLPEDTECPRM